MTRILQYWQFISELHEPRPGGLFSYCQSRCRLRRPAPSPQDGPSESRPTLRVESKLNIINGRGIPHFCTQSFWLHFFLFHPRLPSSWLGLRLPRSPIQVRLNMFLYSLFSGQLPYRDRIGFNGRCGPSWSNLEWRVFRWAAAGRYVTTFYYSITDSVEVGPRCWNCNFNAPSRDSRSIPGVLRDLAIGIVAWCII
jgi:hypothetical protein